MINLTPFPNFTPEELDKTLLKDKIILITGASRGLGRCVALKCAKYGATTILLSSSLKKLEAVYDEIETQGWPVPAMQPINFLGAGPKELEPLAHHIEKMFGRLDGIVHCAADVGQICPLTNLPPEKWLKAIHVNLNIPFMLTHLLIPLLQKSEKANVIFTGDAKSQTAEAHWGAYHASKLGLFSLTQTLAEELENTNIQVNGIYPPPLRTALRINHFPGISPETFLPPENIALDYVYLLSTDHTHRGMHFKW